MNVTLKSRWWLAAGVAITAQLLATVLLSRGPALVVWADTTQMALVAFISVTFIQNARRCHGNTRIFWFWMSSGAILWTTVQWFWFLYEVVLRQDVPSPFLGDCVLFLHIVPMMAALAVQPHFKKDEKGITPGTLDFALLLLWWVYLYIFMVIPWQYLRVNLVYYGNAFNGLYLMEHGAFILAAGYSYRHSSGRWRVYIVI